VLKELKAIFSSWVIAVGYTL